MNKHDQGQWDFILSPTPTFNDLTGTPANDLTIPNAGLLKEDQQRDGEIDESVTHVMLDF